VITAISDRVQLAFVKKNCDRILAEVDGKRRASVQVFSRAE
jgi:hypothetical protein